jgi:hypothetical protein
MVMVWGVVIVGLDKSTPNGRIGYSISMLPRKEVVLLVVTVCKGTVYV